MINMLRCVASGLYMYISKEKTETSLLLYPLERNENKKNLLIFARALPLAPFLLFSARTRARLLTFDLFFRSGMRRRGPEKSGRSFHYVVYSERWVWHSSIVWPAT